MSRFRTNVVASGKGAIAAGGNIGFVSTGDGATVGKRKPERPRVGVSLLVVRDQFVLLGLRKGSHGTDEWGTPGGHQEHGESYEETALRELKEECGGALHVTYPRFLCVTNLRQYISDSGRHYTDVAFVSHWLSGEPELLEPEKCEGWHWCRTDKLPDNQFGAVPNMLQAHRTGRPYFA